jgi:hypothetical protein
MRRKSVKQREVTELDVKSGLAIQFDNGDRGRIEKNGEGKYTLLTTRDGVKWWTHAIPIKSRHVMASLIYVYPSEEL